MSLLKKQKGRFYLADLFQDGALIKYFKLNHSFSLWSQRSTFAHHIYFCGLLANQWSAVLINSGIGKSFSEAINLAWVGLLTPGNF